MEQADWMDEELDLLLSRVMPKEKINFLGEIPCPVKLPVKQAFDAYCECRLGAFVSYIPTTCGLENTEAGRSILSDLLTEGEEELPEIILSFGLRDFFEAPLMHRLLSPERCSTPVPFLPAKPYADLDLQDPEGVFTVFSSLPMVMIADLRQLGDLPLPRRWSDLLDPIYEGALCFPPGEENSIEALPLIHYSLNFGEEGLRRLAKNIGEMTCGSKVAMHAGTGKAKPVSAITWFFANAALKNDGVKLIIPEDGAFLNPVYLASARRLSPELEELRSFLLGEEMTTIWNDNFYPAVSAAVPSRLPEDMTFQWMGWDFIRGRDIKEHIRRLEQEFSRYYTAAHPSAD